MEATNGTTNLNAGVLLPPKIDFYTRLADGQFLESWKKEVRRALGGGNPLHLAVLFKEDLPTIQSLYESNQNNFSSNKKILQHACEFGSREGVIPFLAEKDPNLISGKLLVTLATCNCHGFQHVPGEISALAKLKPGAVSDVDNDGDIYPIAAAMRAGVPEIDIRSLVELWPECIITRMKFEKLGYDRRTPLQYSKEKENYSSDLMDFMIHCIPNKINDFNLNNAWIDAKDIGWIERVFQKCQGKIDCYGINWEGPGLHHFLGVCFLKQLGYNELILTVPYRSRSRTDEGEQMTRADEPELVMQQFKKAYSLQQHQDHPTATKLFLKISDPVYCGLLDVLPKWSKLRDLAVGIKDHLGPSMTALCTLIKKGRLERLNILSTKSATTCSRKRTASSEVVKSPLQPLFDALVTNETITLWNIHPIAEGDINPICELLLEVLKQNKTLERVGQLIHESTTHRGDPFSVLSSSQKELAHYLELNRCGRKTAHEDATTLEEFVSLLGSLGSDQLQGRTWYQRGGYLIDSTRYGLLREGINKWS